jgi:hypothetical protein
LRVVEPAPDAAGGVDALGWEVMEGVVGGSSDRAVGGLVTGAVAAGVVGPAGDVAERVRALDQATLCVVDEVCGGAEWIADLDEQAASVGAVEGGLAAGVDDRGAAAVVEEAALEDAAVTADVDAGAVGVVFEGEARGAGAVLLDDSVLVVVKASDLAERVVDLDQVLAVVDVAHVRDEAGAVGVGQVDLNEPALVVMEVELPVAVGVNRAEAGMLVVVTLEAVTGAIVASE